MSSKALPEIIIYNNVYIVQSDKQLLAQANKIIIICGDFCEVGSEVIWMVMLAPAKLRISPAISSGSSMAPK